MNEGVLFNGTNNDPKSGEIYRQWLLRNAKTDRATGSPTADKRAAIVEYFRDEASIMIATEAAAEGINLQFCNLVVNYDMPWNPQRIEQRIGRCHRYGQKYDVVVVNFLNRSNAADVRIYQLLDQKFRLFDGVFGASDEVIGAIQSGVDFEKRIVSIYQQCRTPEQIVFEFDKLQQELESEITEAKALAQEQLLNNFDQEVIEKVRVEARNSRNRFEELLWKATCFYLAPFARFDSVGYSFQLEQNPFAGETIHPGPYRMGRSVEDANTYRVGHPLAQRILEKCLELETPPAELRFNLSKSGKRIAILDPHAGQSGWLICTKFSINSFEAEDHILFAGVRDDGEVLEPDACKRLFDLPAEAGQHIISKQYNGAMLAEAMCKLMGFQFAPGELYWQQGRSTETDFIYVTTQTLTRDHLAALSEEVGSKRTLLVCCAAFRGKADAYPNLTLRKIPLVVLQKCEWGHDDYSLNVANLPKAPELKPEIPVSGESPKNARRRAAAQDLTPSLFDGGAE